jgi:chromosomal replication initiator protein
MWIRPLQPWVSTDGRELVLWAPNHFVVDWVKSKYLNQIEAVMMDLQPQVMPTLSVKVGSITTSTDIENKKGRLSPENNVAAIPVEEGSKATPSTSSPTSASIEARSQKHRPLTHRSNLNSQFRFDNFVEGKANRWAAAAAQQVAENPGSPGYNPLLLYGGVGLGKTHLMHAVGNTLLQRRPDAKVVYLHSERFVADMVSALRNKTIDDFQRFYRSVDALLIDDIQFFAGKEQSQEEFFHTFNSLMERGQQIILTCDKFPKEIDGLEDRLKSRFGWGLSQLLEPPELETRVAILKRKAEDERITLPDEVAFFIAQRIRSNVRELEGVLKRVIAHIRFTSNPEISVGLVKDALKDVLAIQARMVSIDNIQRMVSDYFKIKIVDLLSKKRTRSIARPRQIAMALSRELTTQSLPEIADAFGGLDHTTVLHACRKVADLRAESPEFEQDYQNLLRSLTS